MGIDIDYHIIPAHRTDSTSACRLKNPCENSSIFILDPPAGFKTHVVPKSNVVLW
jgi:hypothetical protein